MLDAYQVEVIAALTDGGVVHADSDCLPEWEEIERITKTEPLDDGRWPVPDYRRFWEVAEDRFDYRPLIRYSIDEWESSNAYDISDSTLQELLVEEIDATKDLGGDADWDGDTLTFSFTINVEPYIAVICDACGNRIQ